MHPGILKAKLEQVRGIIDRGSFQDVIKEDILRDSNYLHGRLVLLIM